MLNWSLNLKILLHIFDAYNCDYHHQPQFNSIISINTDFPSKKFMSFTVKSPKIGFSNKYY